MSNRGKRMLEDKDANRCQALTVMTEWKKAHHKEERCPFMARWDIHGKLFCRHHAVSEMFAIGLERGDIIRTTTPSPILGQHVRVVKMK